jgi:enoyl-CoA hydratase
MSLTTDNSSGSLVKSELVLPGVLLVELDRPDKLNALSKALLGSLAALLEAADRNDEIRCIVLTGGEEAFSVGADIRELAENGVAAYQDPERLKYWRKVERFPKPIIAAVRGYALGGGCELVMLCDIALAGESAKFGQPEITIASIPGDGGTQRLPRFIGKSQAMQMILTGITFTAQQMKEAGLVSEVLRDEAVVERALELARRIADLPPMAMKLAKAAVLAAYELPLHEGLVREQALTAQTFSTQDRAEGLAAFFEKRAPQFKGR